MFSRSSLVAEGVVAAVNVTFVIGVATVVVGTATVVVWIVIVATVWIAPVAAVVWIAHVAAVVWIAICKCLLMPRDYE